MSRRLLADLRLLTCGVVLSAAGLAFTPGCLLAADKQSFEIPAGAAREALREFGRQARVQLLFDYKAVKDLKTKALIGQFDIETALGLILQGTGLNFERVNERTLAIRSIGKEPLEKTDMTSLDALPEIGGLSGQTMIAMVDIVNAQESKAGSSKKSSNSAGQEVEEMVVEGSREKPAPFSSANLDLTRTKDDALPFTTFTAQDVELSGATTLQEFLQNRLPQNFSDVLVDEGYISSSGKRSSPISMRGWSGAETVFLLNGRRMAAQYDAAGNDSSDTTPDLRGIPLGAIERIEILSSAGSAIYGANATGGVINIITRQNFRGGQFDVNYATPLDVHSPTRGASFNYSLPVYQGFNLRLNAAYNDAEPLRSGDRSAITVERWRQLVLERQPTRLLSRTAGLPSGATTNIRTLTSTATDSLFGPGGSNFTTVPDGYRGGMDITAYTPGTYNLQIAERGGEWGFLSKEGYLGALTSNMNFGLGIDKTFFRDWRWSLDYRYSQVDTESAGYGVFSNTVPGTSVINPFGQDVRFALIDPGLATPGTGGASKNLTWDLSSTLRGAFGEWRGYWDLSYSRNSNSYYGGSFGEPIGGWRNAFITGAYNPFVDIRVVSPASPSFYEHYIITRLSIGGAASQYVSALKISGPAFYLPAGAAQLTAGVEWLRSRRDRSESYQRTEDSITGEPRVLSTSVSNGTRDQNRGRQFIFDTHSAYTELNLPLVANLPMVAKLDLMASGRVDRRVADGIQGGSSIDPNAGVPFRATTQSSVYALGMRYDMVEGLAFRASQSIGFKPPALSQLTPAVPPLPSSTVTINDPRRPNGGVPSTVVLNYLQYISGGNPDLVPESTSSTNFGFIFSPHWAPGLRLSVDYIESVRDDAITSLSAQQAIDLESDLSSRVVRGPTDGHPSGVGPVVFLDLRQINFRQISSRSIDLSLDKRFDDVWGGKLVLTAAATRNMSFKVQTTNTAPAQEQVRNINASFSQQIAWNGYGQLRWEGRQWSLGWTARYYDYVLARSADWILQNSDRAPWKLNHDAFVSYRPAQIDSANGLRHMLAKSSITFGVKNVFDREPRFWAASSDRGVAPYDSIMGRSIWLQMRKEF